MTIFIQLQRKLSHTQPWRLASPPPPDFDTDIYTSLFFPSPEALGAQSFGLASLCLTLSQGALSFVCSLVARRLDWRENDGGNGAGEGQCGLSSRLARQRTPPGEDLSFFSKTDIRRKGNGPKDGTEATSIPLSNSLTTWPNVGQGKSRPKPGFFPLSFLDSNSPCTYLYLY